MSSGRWPPAGHGRAHPAPGRYEEQFTELRKAIGDVSAAVLALAPRVLGTEVIALDINGQASKQYRVPYQSVSVISESAATLTITSGPLSAQPGPGPGAARIPAKCFVVANLAGNAWSVYGGAQGELITVTVYGAPQPPAAAKLA